MIYFQIWNRTGTAIIMQNYVSKINNLNYNPKYNLTAIILSLKA
jgi:hypothetical protein